MNFLIFMTVFGLVSMFLHISNQLTKVVNVQHLNFLQKRVVTLLWPIIAIGTMLYTAYMLVDVYEDGMKM